MLIQKGGSVWSGHVALATPDRRLRRPGICMTIKYLRSCQGNCHININEIIEIEDWSQCECPIDTKIAKTLYRKALDDEKAEIAWKVATSVTEKDTMFSWNYFSEETYTEMQNMIREYCSKNGIIGPLFFDFEYWE